jgi:hypothetical protein
MKAPKINLVAFILILLCTTKFVNAQGSTIEFNVQNNSDFYNLKEIKASNLNKSFSLFVKIKDATIVREIDSKHTWYTWKKALLNEIIPGQAKGHMWCTLLTDDQTIIKMDSATWELYVKVTMLGDDKKKINMNYHSFDIPEINTDSKRYGWMTNASCEAGGSFYRDGYMFEIRFFEQQQDFRFRRIPPTAF